MINSLKSRLLISSLALLLGSASSVMVSATSLPEITSDQIAQDASLSYDSATGASSVIMAGFEPFEQFADLAGTARLKSTGQAVSINGRVVSNGALLDLTLIYTTDSNDPFDMRGYERGIFLSREGADIVRYDNKILECSENVTELAYEESYGSHVPFGFLAGVYMALPRYRGYRDIGGYRTRLNGYTNRSYSSGGYSRGYSEYGYTSPRAVPRRGRGHNDRRSRGRDHRDGIGLSGDRVRPERDRSDRDRSNRDRADRNRRREAREARADRDADSRNRDRDRGERRGARDRDRDGDRQGRGRNGRDRGQETGRRNGRVLNGLAGMRSDTPRAENHTSDRRAPRSQPSVNRNNNRQDRGVSTVKAPPPKANTPRPRSERVRAQRPKKDRNASGSSRDTRPTRAQRQRLNRSVDRNFRRQNPRASQTKKFKNFYPLQSGFATYANPVSISYRCVREENLTLHIPRERLEAARFDGMTVLVLSRDGQETPVYIPPNYIEGYQKARQMIAGTSYTPNPAIDQGYPLITK